MGRRVRSGRAEIVESIRRAVCVKFVSVSRVVNVLRDLRDLRGASLRLRIPADQRTRLVFSAISALIVVITPTSLQ